MEAQISHLKHDAKLNELRSVISVQLEIIEKYLESPIYSTGQSKITFKQILDYQNIARNYAKEILELFNNPASNQVKTIGKALETQLIQLATLCLEYSNESNSKLYALPYLLHAMTLLSGFYKFQANPSIEGLIEEIAAEITKGKNESQSAL